MMNQTLILDNWSFNQSFFAECRLSQTEMLTSVQQIPKNAYYILLLGLAALLFYFFIQPYLSRRINEGLTNHIGVLGVCLVFLSAWSFSLVVFSFGEEQLKLFTKVASFIVVPLLLLLGYVAYRRFRKND